MSHIKIIDASSMRSALRGKQRFEMRQLGIAVTLAVLAGFVQAQVQDVSPPMSNAAPEANAGVKSQDQNGWGAACVKPVWPKESLRRDEQGKVVINFLVDWDGKVLEARVRKSSGFPLLDQAAQQAVERCRFSPYYVDGKPVQAWQNLQYVWTLEDPNPWQYKLPPSSWLNR